MFGGGGVGALVELVRRIRSAAVQGLCLFMIMVFRPRSAAAAVSASSQRSRSRVREARSPKRAFERPGRGSNIVRTNSEGVAGRLAALWGSRGGARFLDFRSPPTYGP